MRSTRAKLGRHLFGIAYRMLGSAQDAEDIVQEAFLWLHEHAEVHARNERALLSTVVVRRSLDQLRSARRLRTDYVGEWLPEPVASDSDDPAVAFERQETLSAAFLLLLERLGNLERAVFVLREVFDYDYVDVARLVERTPENCRRIMSRARVAIKRAAQEDGRSPRAEEPRRVELLRAFMDACRLGSVPRLATALCADVRVHSDGGGIVSSAMNPIFGASACARFLVGVLRKFPPDAVFLRSINGSPGILSYHRGRLVAATTLEITETGVARIYVVRNPHKLRRLARSHRLLGIAARPLGFLRRLYRPGTPPKEDPLRRIALLPEKRRKAQPLRRPASR